MTVKRYPAGAVVPAHILDVEPVGPAGPRPSLTFGAETVVADAGDRFLIASCDASYTGPVVRVGGDDLSGTVNVFAPTKAVMLVFAVETIPHTPDDGGREAVVIPMKPKLAA